MLKTRFRSLAQDMRFVEGGFSYSAAASAPAAGLDLQNFLLPQDGQTKPSFQRIDATYSIQLSWVLNQRGIS